MGKSSGRCRDEGSGYLSSQKGMERDTCDAHPIKVFWPVARARVCASASACVRLRLRVCFPCALPSAFCPSPWPCPRVCARLPSRFVCASVSVHLCVCVLFVRVCIRLFVCAYACCPPACLFEKHPVLLVSLNPFSSALRHLSSCSLVGLNHFARNLRLQGIQATTLNLIRCCSEALRLLHACVLWPCACLSVFCGIPLASLAWM